MGGNNCGGRRVYLPDWQTDRPTNNARDERQQNRRLTMKKLATAIAVTALGATIAFAAPQQEGKAWGHGHRGHHGVFSKKLAEKLNVTDAQKAQIKDIM